MLKGTLGATHREAPKTGTRVQIHEVVVMTLEAAQVAVIIIITAIRDRSRQQRPGLAVITIIGAPTLGAPRTEGHLETSYVSNVARRATYHLIAPKTYGYSWPK